MQASASFNGTTVTGVYLLGLSDSGRDGYLYVPSGYTTSTPVSLVVTLHGDGKDGLDGLAPLYDSAKASGEACVIKSLCHHILQQGRFKLCIMIASRSDNTES